MIKQRTPWSASLQCPSPLASFNEAAAISGGHLASCRFVWLAPASFNEAAGDTGADMVRPYTACWLAFARHLRVLRLMRGHKTHSHQG
jgi:hypothetical protein